MLDSSQCHLADDASALAGIQRIEHPIPRKYLIASDQERVMIDRIKQMERFKAVYFSEQSNKPCMVALRA